MSFRLSFSRSARGVSQTFDRLSQNWGGKFEVMRAAEIDLILLVGGLLCAALYVFRRLRFPTLDTDCCLEIGEGEAIWRELT